MQSFFSHARRLGLFVWLHNKCKKINNIKIDLYHLFDKCAVLAIGVLILIISVQEKFKKENA